MSTARHLATALVLALAGCTVGPRYKAELPAVPSAFAGADADRARAPLSPPVSRSVDLAAWWRSFGDPALDRLIDRALAGNLDRQTAASRVREARDAARAARADLYPQINGQASATHTRISENSGLSSIGSLFGGGGQGGGQGGGAAGGASGGGQGGGSSGGIGGPGLEFDTYQIGLDASFDLDLFGGNRRAAAAAKARAEAQEWSARDTDVAVTAEVARTYLQLRVDQARLAVTQASAKSQADLLDLIAARARGGLTNEVDTVQQRAQLASTQAQVAPLEAQVEAGAHALALLLGEEPGALLAELAPSADPLAALPGAPPAIPVGLPSELLQRRPDVRGAERQLAASVEDVGRATAALYPSINLTGSFSLLSTEIDTLFQGASRNYNIAAQLLAPLFDGGRLRAEKRQTQERAIQAGVAYRKAALTGLKEVADALSRHTADQRQLIVLRAGYADARRAEQLDRAQYLGGLSNLDATLRDQATALQTQSQLVQAQGQMALDLVGLYRALGGGWENTLSPTAEASGVLHHR